MDSILINKNNPPSNKKKVLKLFGIFSLFKTSSYRVETVGSTDYISEISIGDQFFTKMLFFAEFKLHPRLQRIFFLQKEWEKQAPGVLQAHHKRAQKITHFYFLENRGPNREHFPSE